MERLSLFESFSPVVFGLADRRPSKHCPCMEGERIIYAADPAGFIIRFENGFTFYHAGDTGVFGDMKIIGEIYKPELSLLPIGCQFSMDPKEATYASKLLGSKYVIPMHYGTFPVLTGTAEEFVKLMKEVAQTKVFVLKPGETVQ